METGVEKGLVIPPIGELRAVLGRRLDLNPGIVYLRSLGSEKGRRAMQQALGLAIELLTGNRWQAEGNSREEQHFRLISVFPWEKLRYQHIQALRSAMMERGKRPATCNKVRASLRGVMKNAWRLGLISAEEYQRACDVPLVKGETLPRGRLPSIEEIKALVLVCARDNTPAGVRDVAIISLLYLGGLRRAELVSLNREDYDSNTGELKVRGKGNKERTSWLANGGKDALDDWVTIRGEEPGAMFYAGVKGGKIINQQRMTDQAIYCLLQKRCKEAGIKTLTPHDLRRALASHLLDVGVDLVVVQKILGHSDIGTTVRYDHRPEEAKRKAIHLLSIPYQRRIEQGKNFSFCS